MADTKDTSSDMRDELALAARKIAEVITSVFESVDCVREHLVALHREVVAEGEDFTPEHLVQLRPVILEQLSRRPFLDGVGILTAGDLFAEQARFIEWWRHDDDDDVVPLWLNFDPTSVDIYDYLEMEWFLRAERDNARTVYGPYLDYTGADRYVVTMMAPAVDDRFLGVVGADVRMEHFEAEILPILYDLDSAVALVNAERRVVLTNTREWTVGSRLPSMPSSSDANYLGVARIDVESEWVLAALNAVG
ncbi:MAG TPA: cache domain-containing protein [Acidimicrobiales bacterium]|nr:cache domain-containing protein [Acidimicrobiales bacterium]